MIIGNNITTVQRVSGYCLKQHAEVFPYYGIPTIAEVTLFDPHVLVICLPMPDDFHHLLFKPCILCSEQPMEPDMYLVTTAVDLHESLYSVLQT
ncbi:MAG: hypothetical protein KME23_02925 [Goleter apudmare HA4340-LM2]|jgi:hypothetical protein|nr:hypothetical protein [Goleter apudmare HA4340-LM2]